MRGLAYAIPRSALGSISAELDEAGLFRIQTESERRHHRHLCNPLFVALVNSARCRRSASLRRASSDLRCSTLLPMNQLGRGPGSSPPRRSMLALIDKGEPHEAHPAYWAPFVVVGEGAATTR